MSRTSLFILFIDKPTVYVWYWSQQFCSKPPNTCNSLLKRIKNKVTIDLTKRLPHHHHQVPDLEQTLATMPLQTSLSLDNFKKFKPLLCPPVAELQRLSRNVIRCLPLSRLPSTLPVKDKNSKPLRLHTCPKNSICLFLIVFNSDL